MSSVILCFEEALTRPRVEVHSASTTSIAVQWGNINEDVSSWIVEVTNKDTAAVKVR